MEKTRCPTCGYDNPNISRCIECGGTLAVMGRIPGIDPKDLVQRPKGIWFFLFSKLVTFVASSMVVVTAANETIFVFFGLRMLLSGMLVYGLWKLKPWTRHFMLFIGYARIVIALWPFSFYAFLPPAYYEKITSMFYGRLAGQAYSRFPGGVIKTILVSSFVSVLLSGISVFYFHLPKIRRLFEEEPSNW